LSSISHCGTQRQDAHGGRMTLKNLFRLFNIYFFSIGAKMNGKTRNTNNNHYNNTEENTTLLKKAEQK
jgi:hypothetical protein